MKKSTMNQDNYLPKKKDNLAFKILAAIFVFIYLPAWLSTIYLSIQQDPYTQNVLPVLGSDSLEYAKLSIAIGKLHCFSLDSCKNPEFFRTPGYPLFVYLSSIGNISLFLTTLIQIILSLTTAYIIFLIASKLYSSKISYLAMVIYAIDPVVILHSNIILSDVPFVFLIVLAVYLFFNNSSYAKIFFSSILIGLAVLLRPIAIFIPIIFIMGYLLMHHRNFSSKTFLIRLILLMTGVLVITGPWYWRNFKLTHEISLSSVSSFNLFYYNIPMFLSEKTKDNLTTIQDSLILKYGLRIEDSKKLENSGKIQSYALREIKGEYISYLVFHLESLTHFFFGSSIKTLMASWNEIYTNDVDFQFQRNLLLSDLKHGNFDMFFRSLISNVPVLIERIIWVLLLILSLVSVLVAKERKIMIIFIGMIMYFAFLTGPVSYSRYRIPALPFMLLTSLYTIDWYVSQRKFQNPSFKGD